MISRIYPSFTAIIAKNWLAEFLQLSHISRGVNLINRTDCIVSYCNILFTILWISTILSFQWTHVFPDDIKVFSATVFISIVTSKLIEKVSVVMLRPNPCQTVRAEVYTIKIQPSPNHFSSRFNNKACEGIIWRSVRPPGLITTLG